MGLHLSSIIVGSSQPNNRGEDKQADDLTCTSADCERQIGVEGG